MSRAATAPALSAGQKVWRTLVVTGLLVVSATMVMVIPGKGAAGEIPPEVGIPVTVVATIAALLVLVVAHAFPPAYAGESEGVRERKTMWTAVCWGWIGAVGIVVALRLFIIATGDFTEYGAEEIGIWFGCTLLNVLMVATHGTRAQIALKKASARA